MIELLSPAGSMEALRAAVQNGANAVYLGYDQFNARMNAKNFSADELQEAIVYCHVRGVAVHLTLNTLVADREMARAADVIRLAATLGVDAFIVQDIGMVQLCREIAPNVAVHASTQMSIHSLEGVIAAAELGCSRVVLSRELPREEIAAICRRSPIEIEVFVHGALCMCYSGQCYLSGVIGRRSGNRGQCAQPCRLPYGYGRFDQNRYPLSLKDNCLIEYLRDLERMGVASLKIEGRMKTALYVATVARTYRKAIDDYLENPEKYKANMEWYKEEIGKCTYREFTTGFYFGKPTSETQIYDSNTYVKNYIYLGTAEERDARGFAKIEQKNKFSVGETIEIMKPDGRNISALVRGIYTEEGESQESAPHPKQVLYIDLDGEVEQYDILRKKEAE